MSASILSPARPCAFQEAHFAPTDPINPATMITMIPITIIIMGGEWPGAVQTKQPVGWVELVRNPSLRLQQMMGFARAQPILRAPIQSLDRPRQTLGEPSAENPLLLVLRVSHLLREERDGLPVGAGR